MHISNLNVSLTNPDRQTEATKRIISLLSFDKKVSYIDLDLGRKNSSSVLHPKIFEILCARAKAKHNLQKFTQALFNGERRICVEFPISMILF